MENLELTTPARLNKEEDERLVGYLKLRSKSDPKDEQPLRKKQRQTKQTTRKTNLQLNRIKCLQHLPRVDDPPGETSHDFIPLRAQPLQRLSVRLPSSRPNQKEFEIKIIEMHLVSAKDRVLCLESKFDDFDLHLQQQQGTAGERKDEIGGGRRE